MSKFQIGDKVRIIGESRTGKILDFLGDYSGYLLDYGNGYSGIWLEHELALIEEEKEIGYNVEILGIDHNADFEKELQELVEKYHGEVVYSTKS